jgi:hypothetical protein
LAADKHIGERLEDSWKMIREGLPYFDVVDFNESLYQFSVVSCDAVWSGDQKKVEAVQQYMKSKIASLRQKKTDNQEEKVAKDMLSTDLEVMLSILDQAYKQMHCEDGSGRCPPPENAYGHSTPLAYGKSGKISSDVYHYIESAIVKMILNRDTSEAGKIQEKMNKLVIDAYTKKDDQEFKKLCAYTNALIFFRSAVSLT